LVVAAGAVTEELAVGVFFLVGFLAEAPAAGVAAFGCAALGFVVAVVELGATGAGAGAGVTGFLALAALRCAAFAAARAKRDVRFDCCAVRSNSCSVLYKRLRSCCGELVI
jgi:hypothetical protein